MAEFALGLTKTAVTGTLSRVKSAIKEEAELKEQVQDDLVFITGEFQMMQSFLNASNAGERASKNQVVRTWLRQLRDLAFDVEDCVEFVVHLESPPWTNSLWRVVPSCIAPSRPLDQAVAEIKRLKARVTDVSLRNTRYNLMVDSMSAADQHIMLPPPTSSIATSAAAFDVLTEVWEAAGKLRTTGGIHLKELITSDDGNHLQVISLWGSQGAAHLGASDHFIREAYDDPEICQDFTTRAWVKLTTTSAFNPDEFLDGLLAQFYQLPATAATTSNNRKAWAKLLQQFNTKRYLLVIEGVSSVVEWDAIRMYLPDNNNGSRIIVSTQHLRIALLCTGHPYQVTLLTRFSDGQSLCAFSKSSVLRRDMGELIWQIRRGGVISLLGNACRDRMRQLYKGIMHKRKEFDGVVEFQEQSWVDVSDPFNINAFYVGLFLDFQSRDFQANEIAAVGRMGLNALAERCRRYLRDDDCLVVINGLQSKEHWDHINRTFLLSGPPTTKGTSIIVITEEEGVAKHCVDHQQHRVVHSKGVDKALDGLMKDYRCYGIGGKEDSRRAHLLFHDPRETYYWCNDFKLVGRQNELAAINRQIQDPGVISVWGHSGVGKSVIVKKVYYTEMHYWQPLFEYFSFVDVPARDPFDLTDFSWHLLLDIYSRTPLMKQNLLISLFQGQEDPIRACCWLLQQTKCLVVIDGLRSEGDWDKIRDTFLSSDQPTRGCIVVITKEENVARHCAVDDRVLGVKRLRVLRHRPLTEQDPPGRFLYDREEEAHTSWADEFHFVGRREDSSRFDNLIRNDVLIRRGVFSVWGVAGVGKSALVRDYFRRKQGCICVDVPVPFHLTEFSWRLLLGFHSNDLEAKEIAAVGFMEGQDTVHRCCEIIRDNPCFLVIDGLSSTHDWDLIRASLLPEHTDQRKAIIVISNEASVAKHCASHDKSRVLNVKGLNAADSFGLFRKIAWGAGKNRLTIEEREFSKAILAKCGGLPKVIAAIGEYVADTLFYGSLTNTSIEIHRDFIGKLETDSRFHSLRGLFYWMQSFFDACSDSLKPCIFYLSIFQNIRQRRMLRRWIAEGYSTDTFAGGTTEDNGEMLFAQLVELSIIQQPQTPSSSSSSSSSKMVYQVNGFFLEYIKSRPMEDNLVFALEGHCSPNTGRMIQHLAIMSSWDRDQIVFESMDFTRLRSLTVFGEWRSFFISKDTKMRLLRVLDLEDTTSGLTDEVLEQIMKLLPRLKFLSLRGCQDINRLPDSLGGLRLLQTLDIRHTKIRTLPCAIIELVKLQYLRAGTTHTSSGEGHDAVVIVDIANEDNCSSVNHRTPASRGDDVLANEDNCSSVASSYYGTPASRGDDFCEDVLAANEDNCSSVASSYYGTPGSLIGDFCEDDLSDEASSTSDGNGVATISQPAAADGDRRSTASRRSWRSRVYDVVESCRKKLHRRPDPRHDDGIVEFVPVAARGFGKLTALHTLGVVHVGSGAGGKAFLEELKKLTQLRKLGVSGINRKNWFWFCVAISRHGHLESLSVRIDDGAAILFSGRYEYVFFYLPKTLKSLKLYAEDGNGNVHVSPVLMIKQPSNLTKFNFKLTVSRQLDIDSLAEVPIDTSHIFRHLYVKPIRDGQLCYGPWRDPSLLPAAAVFRNVKVLEIDCGRYRSEIFLGNWVPKCVALLVVHCSSITTESSLELPGLDELICLKEVWLKGSYGEAVKQHLQQKLAELTIPTRRKRPVLKLEGEQIFELLEEPFDNECTIM